MKVLLVQPRKPRRAIGGDDIHLLEPLALEYIGASVLDRHEVRLLDLRLEDDLPRVLRDFAPEVVGVTAYTVHVPGVRELLRQVKRWRPGATTVVGGHHATVAPEDFFGSDTDVVVIGEGVRSFPVLVDRLAAGAPLDGIPGIAYRDGEAMRRTPPAPPPDLDTFPLPARSLTKAHRHRYFTQWMKPMASMVTSKGCPFRCSFCALWKLTDGRRLGRDPRRLVEELRAIEEEFVFFADYESLIDEERMSELARLIEEAGITKKYCLYCRADTVVRHPELLRQWRAIGLEAAIVGFESFRADELKEIRKETTPAQNEEAIRILQSLGVNMAAYFIVRPELTKSDFAALRDYCRQMRLDVASFFVLTPLPGTDLYEEVKGELLTHDYELFDFFHTVLPTALPLQEFYAELHRTYTGVVSPGGALSLLRKFPPSRRPAAAWRSLQLLRRIKHAHRDHGSGTEGG